MLWQYNFCGRRILRFGRKLVGENTGLMSMNLYCALNKAIVLVVYDHMAACEYDGIPFA